MIDSTDVRCYKLVAQASDDDEAGCGAAAGPRPGKEPPEDPTPGDHGPDPDEPLYQTDLRWLLMRAVDRRRPSMAFD